MAILVLNLNTNQLFKAVVNAYYPRKVKLVFFTNNGNKLDLIKDIKSYGYMRLDIHHAVIIDN